MDGATATTTSPDEGQGTDVTKVSLEVAKAENEAVEAAMAKVTSLVDGIAKAAGISDDASDGLSNDASGDGAAADDEGEVSEDVLKAADNAAKAAFRKQLEKQGLTGKKLEDAMAKRFGTKKTQKNAEGDDDAAAPVSDINPEDLIEATLDTIQKAKGMTPARIAKLNEAIETLMKLQMEVIGTGASPKTKVPGVSQHSNPSPTRSLTTGGNVDVSKLQEAVTELQEAVAKRDEALSGQLAEVNKRLDGIEGARPSPKSGDGDGDTETTETKKSLWNGIL